MSDRTLTVWLSSLGVLDDSDQQPDTQLPPRLQDGIVLCEALNALQPNAIPTIYRNISARGAKRENLENFVRECQALLPPETKFFEPAGFAEQGTQGDLVIGVVRALMLAANQEVNGHAEGTGEDDEVGEENGGFDLAQFGTGRRAIALYAYAGTKSDELSFSEGAIIELISTPDEGWWEGRIGDMFGWFPTPYVQEFDGEPPVVEADNATTAETGTAKHGNTRLSADEVDPEHRQQVINEIVESEYNFIMEVESFLRKYGTSFRELPTIPDKAKKALFSNLFRTVQFHNQFYDRLAEETKDPNYGRLFISSLPGFYALYTKYFTAHPLCVDVFKRYRNEPSFVKLFQEEEQRTQQQGLAAVIVPMILNRPIERVKKYPVLLKELARHTPDSHADKAALLQAVGEYTRMVGAVDNMRRLKDFERTLAGAELEGLTQAQLLGLGDLEYYTTVLARGRDGSLKERVLCLYRDALLVFNRTLRSGQRAVFRLKDKYGLGGLVVSLVEDSEEGEHVFSMGTDKKTLLLALAHSAADRDEAISALQLATEQAGRQAGAGKKSLTQRINQTLDRTLDYLTKQGPDQSPTPRHKPPPIQRSHSSSDQHQGPMQSPSAPALHPVPSMQRRSRSIDTSAQDPTASHRPSDSTDKTLAPAQPPARPASGGGPAATLCTDSKPAVFTPSKGLDEGSELAKMFGVVSDLQRQIKTLKADLDDTRARLDEEQRARRALEEWIHTRLK